MSPPRPGSLVVPGRGLRWLGLGLVLLGLVLPWAMVLGRAGWAAREAARPPRDGGAVRPEMVALPVGSFVMGDDASENRDEKPSHPVTIKTRFALSVTEVTQGQYERVMGENPSELRGAPDRPVENVSFVDAAEYCNRLSRLEGLESCYEIEGEAVRWPKGLACRGYRLPTEAEWEYAARAGQAARYAGGDEAAKVAWFGDNAENKTHPVAGLQPNAWGLYDMSGNVWEWVWDWYGADTYARAQKTGEVDPLGPPSGSWRFIRGGSIDPPAGILRVASRLWVVPASRGWNLGIRLARSFPSEDGGSAQLSSPGQPTLFK